MRYSTLQELGIAAHRLHLGVHVVAIGLHLLDALHMRHDGVGVGGGEALAAVGAAGLGDHRPALRAGAGVERPAAAVVLALVVDRMHLGGVDEDAALAVGDDGARVPAVPELGHDLDVLIRHVVAEVVIRQLGVAEVLRREVGTAGHHVPAGAPARHLVQRADGARHQIGRVGEGGERRHDAEMPRRRHHEGRHHRAFLARHRHAVLEVDVARLLPHLADVDRVLDQEIVEAGALDRPREVEEHLRRAPFLADVPGPLLAPGLDAGALQEPREVKAVGGHGHLP